MSNIDVTMHSGWICKRGQSQTNDPICKNIVITSTLDHILKSLLISNKRHDREKCLYIRSSSNSNLYLLKMIKGKLKKIQVHIMIDDFDLRMLSFLARSMMFSVGSDPMVRKQASGVLLVDSACMVSMLRITASAYWQIWPNMFTIELHNRKNSKHSRQD